jgi:uncharacterized protein
LSGAVIVDTGPLVALVNRRDRAHPWVKETLAALAPPLLTCEAVVSEACFLLRNTHRGSDAILGLCEDGIVQVEASLSAEPHRVRALMLRYAEVPMSLADACLVWLSERHGKSRILTLDSDFRVYRRNGRQMIPLLTPE